MLKVLHFSVFSSIMVKTGLEECIMKKSAVIITLSLAMIFSSCSKKKEPVSEISSESGSAYVTSADTSSSTLSRTSAVTGSVSLSTTNSVISKAGTKKTASSAKTAKTVKSSKNLETANNSGTEQDRTEQDNNPQDNNDYRNEENNGQTQQQNQNTTVTSPATKTEKPKTTTPKTEKSKPKPKPTEAPKPAPETSTIKKFDVNSYVNNAIAYGQSIGLILDSSATACWDTPIYADANCIYIERDLKDTLEFYVNSGFNHMDRIIRQQFL